LTDFAYTKAAIGPKNLARLQRIETAIVNGAITPPDSREALAAFKPVAL